MQHSNEQAKKLFSEIRPLLDNIDPDLIKISNEDIIKTSQIAQSLAFKPSKSALQQAQSFYQQAKKDLRSSKVLYADKEFGNSVYFFQQCIEKASKAYGLRTGLLKNARKISHASPLVFIEMCKNVMIENNVIEIFEHYTGKQESVKILNAEKLIKSDADSAIFDALNVKCGLK